MDIEANIADAMAGKVIAAIATDIGKLSTEIADVVGHSQSVQQALERQNERLKDIGVATEDIADANHAIADMARRTHQGAERARDDIDQSRRQIDHAIVEIDGLVAAVEQSGGELAGLEQAMARVAEVTGEIRNVARQTNMLALNATIEAARAGEAGRGFAVVAGEVKALARQTAEATARIDSTLAALTGQLHRLTDRMAISADRAGEVSRTAATIGGAVQNVGQAVSLVVDDAAAIAGATDGIASRCDGFREQVKALEGDSGQSKVALDKAAANLANTLGGAEKILMMTASSGYPTEDSPFIDEACKVAAAIEARFQQAIERREISVEDLFDKALQPIAGSAPQQFMTRYIPFLDQAVTPLIDKALELDRRVVFCAPIDHNLLLPCHNPAFRHPQGKDPVWNASHCRNRRIFDDKTARAAATSSAPFLLQTYRRDMGGGVFVLMKDASAPIRVEGRLWGGLRLCYTA